MSGISNFFRREQPVPQERIGCVKLVSGVSKNDFVKTVENNLPKIQGTLNKEQYKAIKNSISPSENGLSRRQQLNHVISQNTSISERDLSNIFRKNNNNGSIPLNHEQINSIKEELISDESNRAGAPLKSGITRLDFSKKLEASRNTGKYEPVINSIRTENGTTPVQLLLNETTSKEVVKEKKINRSIVRENFLNNLKEKENKEVPSSLLSKEGQDSLKNINSFLNTNITSRILSDGNNISALEKRFIEKSALNELDFLHTLKEVVRTGCDTEDLKTLFNEYILESSTDNINQKSSFSLIFAEININSDSKKKFVNTFSQNPININNALSAIESSLSELHKSTIQHVPNDLILKNQNNNNIVKTNVDSNGIELIEVLENNREDSTRL